MAVLFCLLQNVSTKRQTKLNEKKMAHPAGFEPAASAFGGQRSIQLSYGCLNLGLGERETGFNPNLI